MYKFKAFFTNTPKRVEEATGGVTFSSSMTLRADSLDKAVKIAEHYANDDERVALVICD